MGRQFAAIIQKDPDFELALEPQTNIVCFRMVQKQLSKQALNTLNERLRFALVQEGSFYIVQTKLRGTHYLRVTIMNPKTDPDTLSALLIHLKELAKPILQNLT
jgi:L-2,4-diaminobutyrate decarboxylase